MGTKKKFKNKFICILLINSGTRFGSFYMLSKRVRDAALFKVVVVIIIIISATTDENKKNNTGAAHKKSG